MSKSAVRASPVPAGAAREDKGDSPPVGGDLAGPQPFRAAIHKDDPPPLVVALEEINNLTETALEAEDPIPSNDLREVASTQLRRLYDFAPFHYGVSSLPDDGIGIHACPKLEHSIALALLPDGKVLFFAFVPGEEYVESFPSVDGLTDDVFAKAGNLLKRALGQGG